MQSIATVMAAYTANVEAARATTPAAGDVAQHDDGDSLPWVNDSARTVMERTTTTAPTTPAAGESPNDRDRQRFVKSYTNLGAHCYTIGRDREYRIWMIARWINFSGSGQITLAELEQELSKLNMRGSSWRNVQRLLKSGEGTFWYRLKQHGQWVLRLRGQEKVGAVLGLESVGRPVYIARSKLRRLEQFRAAIVRAAIEARSGPGWNNPRSRYTIEQMTGIDRTKQKRWEKSLGRGFDKRQNVAPVDPNRHIPEYHQVEVGKFEKGRDKRYRYAYTKDGKQVLLEQLPNSYHVNRNAVKLAPRGMSRRINGRLRAQSLSCAEGKDAQSSVCKRRYIDIPKGDAKAAGRALNVLAKRVGELLTGEAVFETGANIPGVGYRKELSLPNGPEYVTVQVWHRHGPMVEARTGFFCG